MQNDSKGNIFQVSTEASGGIGFVAIEIIVRKIVAFYIGGRGYIKECQS
tara:strand:+ start:638 stop:784 length:147 start_codon:yes stop_codon:yes gene_type:complete